MQKKVKQENKKKADEIKRSKIEDNVAVQLKTKVYGGFQPPEFFDEERTTAYNSIN